MIWQPNESQTLYQRQLLRWKHDTRGIIAEPSEAFAEPAVGLPEVYLWRSEGPFFRNTEDASWEAVIVAEPVPYASDGLSSPYSTVRELTDSHGRGAS